ncbi:MAG: hypothetical protein ACO1SV_16020 [Fimbriimonas sp.]
MTILSTLVAVAAVGSDAAAAPVSLGRIFTPKEKLTYAVRSSLHSETRPRGLQTWIPEDLDINYDFTMQVEAMKTDGIVVMRYQRPTMTEIQGETFDKPPVVKKQKIGYDFRLTVSPFNEVLEMKDLTPPKKPTKKTNAVYWRTPAGRQILQSMIGQFVSEVYRLSLFVGNFESALDFAPRTPFDAVSVGDTWKRTVGYQPQKLKGKDGKMATQRLDFTYTYKGLANGAKGKVHRVEGKLSFNTDLAEFVNQTFEVTSDQTGLKSVPLSMESTIVFDLDQKTRHALEANAQSDGQFKIILTDNPDDPVQEEKIKGRTTLRLVSRTIGAPVKKK